MLSKDKYTQIMDNCITLKNLDLCKNTILYLLALQIPGNRESILKHDFKASNLISSAGTVVKNIEVPNLLIAEKGLSKLDLVDGVDPFVIGYLAKTIDIGIINNFNKFVTKNIQIPMMFRSIISNFYVINSSEILFNITQNNYYFIKQTDPDPTTLKFGLGSYAALIDYLNFERENHQSRENLFHYLTCNKKKVMKDIESGLNQQITNNDIYKNDLYISTLLEIRHIDYS